MWIAYLGRARWAVAAEIQLGDSLIAEARQAGYFVAIQRLRPVRAPKRLKADWLAVQAPGEPD